MIFVSSFFALILAYGALKARRGVVQAMLIFLCVLNLMALGQTIHESKPFAARQKAGNPMHVATYCGR